MPRAQRNKGKRGERELAALLSEHIGLKVTRRVRNSESDSDLLGVECWSVECKRCKVARLAEWWAQTIEQAAVSSEWPVLFYRLDGKKWRAVWPLAAAIFKSLDEVSPSWFSQELTVESSIEAWTVVYRDVLAGAV